MSLLFIAEERQGLSDMIMIPAVFDEEYGLVFQHNGISARFFSEIDFDKFKRSDFRLLTMEPYLRKNGEFFQIPFFLYEGEVTSTELWQLFYVTQKRGSQKGRLLYTILKPCPQYTCVCSCSKGCGRKFILNSGTYKYYMDKDLVLPVDRCPTCREKRKIMNVRNT